MKEKDRTLEKSLFNYDRNTRLLQAPSSRNLPINNFDNEEDLLYLGTQPRAFRNQDGKDHRQTPNFFDHVSRIHDESDEFQDIDDINTKPHSPSELPFPSEPPSSSVLPSPSEPPFLLEPLPLISLSQGLTASQLPPSTAPITRTPRGVARKKTFQQRLDSQLAS